VPESESTIVRGGKDRSTLLDVTPSGDASSDRLSLLVISDRVVVTKPLPPAGDLRIGRAPDVDLVIDDPSISRSHAILSIGPPLTITDLGSANGTMVGDRPLAPSEKVPLSSGDVIRVGSTTLIVQRRSRGMLAQRIVGHDYFEVRLDEECTRAERDDKRFAIARIVCRPPPSPTVIHEVLTACGRENDVVGEYSPGEIEILMVDTSADEARAAIDQLTAALRHRRIEGKPGLACFPGDGRTSHVLMHRASPVKAGRAPRDDFSTSGAVVVDPRMQELYRLAERIGAGQIPVLILGETGVGKEVLAERLHRMSPRADKPYLKLNCAALSETLLESELFGYEKGAFTGAAGTKPGLLESANGGSVFLDEIGELPYTLQVKLLRVLEERSVLRVGGLKPRPLDVRFFAATNRDLDGEIARGAFRQDLYFRLSGAILEIPPLRERLGEIAALAAAFAETAAQQVGLAGPPAIADEALALLQRYSWPGNIRELRNVIDRAVLLCGAGPIMPRHLPLEKMQATHYAGEAPPAAARVAAPRAPEPAAPRASAPSHPPHQLFGSGPMRDDAIPFPLPGREDDTQVNLRVDEPPDSPDTAGERERILEALAACMGNQTAAAKRLGIARRTLINKLERYGISGPRKQR
jgi:two-component system, NtrC family, response regulator AtoC